MQNRFSWKLGLLVLTLTASIAGWAQQSAPLSLQQAVALALQKSPEKQISGAAVEMAHNAARQARTALLPNLQFSESATRGNDPVYAFGARLRQQRFAQSDFALNNLNRPTPLNNFSSRFTGNWLAFDSWHTQFEIHRADLMAKSTAKAATRADQQIVQRTVAAYEGILFAMRQLEVAQHDVETARALQASSASRVAAGIAVDADELAANANLAQRQQTLIAAQGNLQIAWAELEAAIGQPIPDADRQLQPLEERQFAQTPLTDAIALAMRSRPDLQSLTLQKEAQNAAVHSAWSGFGPQISTFGSWETDRPAFAGAGGNNWMAGAELRINLLPAAQREKLAAARIGQRQAAASSAAADQQIRLEVTRAWYEHQSAAQMLDVARTATAQSDENLRILKNRYEAGLATITDLLRAEDTQRQSRADYWQAVFQNTLTFANLKFATGTLASSNVGDLQ